MINLIPYVIAGTALFLHHNNTNRACVGLFIFFYSISLVFHSLMLEDPRIFHVNLVLTAIFYMLLVQFSKVTAMMVVFCVTDVVLVLIDVVSFLAYHYGLEALYQAPLNVELAAIYVQWIALWITDDRSINLRRYYVNIKLFIFNHSVRVLYR